MDTKSNPQSTTNQYNSWYTLIFSRILLKVDRSQSRTAGSTNWREQPESCKELTHWDNFFLLFLISLVNRIGLPLDFLFTPLVFFPFFMSECSRQTQIQWSELCNIPQFQCWDISKPSWPMWDYLKPDWSVIIIVWLRLKINTLDVSQIESEKNKWV